MEIVGGPRFIKLDLPRLHARFVVRLFWAYRIVGRARRLFYGIWRFLGGARSNACREGPDPGGLGFWEGPTAGGGPNLQFRQISLILCDLRWFWGGPAWAQGWAQAGSGLGPRVVLKWFWDRARTPEPPEPACGPTNSPFGTYNNMTLGGVWGLGRLLIVLVKYGWPGWPVVGDPI